MWIRIRNTIGNTKESDTPVLLLQSYLTEEKYIHLLHHARLQHGLLLLLRHHPLLLHPHLLLLLLLLSHAGCAQLPRLLLLDDGADSVHEAHLVVGDEAQVGLLLVGVEQDEHFDLTRACAQTARKLGPG
jgi:hypothetical protein